MGPVEAEILLYLFLPRKHLCRQENQVCSQKKVSVVTCDDMTTKRQHCNACAFSFKKEWVETGSSRPGWKLLYKIMNILKNVSALKKKLSVLKKNFFCLFSLICPGGPVSQGHHIGSSRQISSLHTMLFHCPHWEKSGSRTGERWKMVSLWRVEPFFSLIQGWSCF